MSARKLQYGLCFKLTVTGKPTGSHKHALILILSKQIEFLRVGERTPGLEMNIVGKMPIE
jgi:hypothetical protein